MKSTQRLIIAFTAIPVVLWVLALLFVFRIVNIFDKYLMKFPGPIVIWGAMLLCPLAGIFLGFKVRHSNQYKKIGEFSFWAGVILTAVFIGVIGIPMILNIFSPKIPINPSIPRAYVPETGLPVFPGAEGFGTRTIAGRGGKVIIVTSLKNNGPGTLREAVNTPEPRTIVFQISGNIELTDELQVQHPFITIAGQTAPGGGIGIEGAGITIMTHDVLIQHLRIRPGNKGPIKAENNDALAVFGAHGTVTPGAYNVVIDHVSASWGEDETISTWYGAHDVTLSWSFITEALNRSRHQKETHSAGLLIGDSSYNISIHHNLLAHNDFRNPLIIDGGTHDIVNNIIYNWGAIPAEIVDLKANSFLNFVGNNFIPGPSTLTGPYEILFNGGNPKIFVQDNIGPHRADASLDHWSLVGFGWGEEGTAPEKHRVFSPFQTPPITVFPNEINLEKVLTEAGAVFPRRDRVDQRIVRDVRDNTGKIIDSPEEVGGYPDLSGGNPSPDNDQDGLPDEWELNHGLDPKNPADSSNDADKDGYTNLEEYLHMLGN